MRQLNDDYLAERAEMMQFDQELFARTKPSQATMWIAAGLLFAVIMAAFEWWRR